MSATSLIANLLKPAFTFDRRAIRFFRSGVSILLIIDLLLRSRSLNSLYTCQSLFPFALIQSQFFPSGHLSIHGLFCEKWQIVVLFVAQFSCALLMFLDIRTKLSTLIALFLLISLQQRNPLILYGGDTLLRVLLLWSLFLPSGRRLQSKENYFGVGSLCYVLQLLLMYWYTASGKNGPAWQDGSAIHYVFQYESFATPFAVMYRDLLDPILSGFGARLVIAFEFLGPLFWFSPIAHSRLKMTSICAFVLMHLVFGTFIVLDIFPLVNFVSFLPLVPSEVWDTFFPTSSSEESSPDSDSGATSLIGGMIFGMILIWNLDRWPGRTQTSLPPWFQRIFQSTYLQQKWIFFEPDPPRDGGWWIVSGRTRSGNLVDVFHLTPMKPVWTKPEFISSEMKDSRWVKVYSNIWLKENEKFRKHLAAYLCREWSSLYPEDPLVNLEVDYLYYRPEPENDNLPFPVLNRILQFTCPADSIPGFTTHLP